MVTVMVTGGNKSQEKNIFTCTCMLWGKTKQP